MKFKNLIIGIPKEIMKNENRVAAIPETVHKLHGEGAVVLVEKNAGAGSFFSDEEYQNAGAEIISDVRELFARSHIIMKVKEPKMNETYTLHEVDMMKQGQVLITFIHPANPGNHAMVHKLAEKGVTGISLDCIPRITRAQSMDALTSMSTVAGYKGIITAACKLPKFIPMLGTAVGVVKPAVVFVVGVGVAGLQALATAKRLGAAIYAADIRPDAAEQALSLGAKIVDTTIPPEAAIGEGGYAKHLSEEYLRKEREAIKEIVSQADILVLTALIPKKIAPILITDEMVRSMKPGSYIVDISVDQGGNCALTEAGAVTCRYDVYIDGTQNIPGSVPSSSSWMFAQNIYNLVSLVVKDGKINLDMDDEILRSALITDKGKIVNADVVEEINLYNTGGLS